MGYFGGSSRFAGDPGLFSTLVGLGKKALGFTPLAPAVQLIPSFRRPSPRQVTRVPGVRGAVQRALPGGRTGFEVEGLPRKRGRRMNVGNAKALRRAIRRQEGFVKLARRALQGTGYQITSKGAGKVSQAQLRKAVAEAHSHHHA